MAIIKTTTIDSLTSSNNGSYYRTADGLEYYDISRKELADLGLTEDTGRFIPDTYCWLNYHVYEPITGSSHILGFPLDIQWNNVNNTAYNRAFVDGFYSSGVLSNKNRFSYLNALLLKRNGPYQYPMWKQLRNSDHPLIRYYNKENIITILEPSEEKRIKSVSGEFFSSKAIRSGIVTDYVESPVTIKYKPVIQRIMGQGTNKVFPLSLVYTYANNLGTMVNPDLINKIGSSKESKQIYDRLLKLGVGADGEDSNAIKNLGSLTYSETIFPKESNTFLDRTRNRKLFDVGFWNNNRGLRNSISSSNSQGYIVNQSKWPMDERNDYLSTCPQTSSWNGYEGELQNNYTTFFENLNPTMLDPSFPGNTKTKVIRFNYYAGDDIPLTPFRSPTPNLNTTETYHHEGISIGSIKFDDPAAGYYSEYPWGTNDIWNNYIGTAAGAFANYTFSAWINVTSSLSSAIGATAYPERWEPPVKQTILCFGDNDRHFYVKRDDADLTKRYLAFSAQYDTNFYEWVTTDQVIDINTWYHVAATFRTGQPDAAKAEFYVNGVSKAVTAPNTGIATISAIADTGSFIASCSFSASAYEGMMSDISIWGDRLTLNEIQEIYNEGYPASLYLHSARSDLISWYRLGDGTGLNSSSGPPDTLWYGINVRILQPAGSLLEGTNPFLSFTKERYDFDIINNKGNDGKRADLGERDFYSNPGVLGPVIDGGPFYRGVPQGYNTLFDMVGDRHGYFFLNMSSSDLIDAVGLTGSADRRKIGWDYSLKQGALYSRPTFEYYKTPWPYLSITCSCNQKRDVRYRGHAKYVNDSRFSSSVETGKVPYSNTYGENFCDLRTKYKDFSLVPEFRISEHVESYVDNYAGNFLADKNNILSITGSEVYDSSLDNFYSIYSHTDFLKYFDVVKEDYKNNLEPEELTLKCNAILKFVPYAGLYPSDRTLQLAQLFSKSYGENVSPSSYGDNTYVTSSWRSFLSPFFAPGILYNSIKSGMAVDFPLFVGEEPPKYVNDFKAGSGGKSLFYLLDLYNKKIDLSSTSVGIYGTPISSSTFNHFVQPDFSTDGGAISLNSSIFDALGVDEPRRLDDMAEWNTVLAGDFNLRLPFEALVEPENFVSKMKIWDMNPEDSSSFRYRLSDYTSNQSSYWNGGGSQKYKMAMHNFLAEVPTFFLKEQNFTSFSSKPIPTSGIIVGKHESNKYYAMDFIVYNSECRSVTDYFSRLNLKQFSTSSVFDYRISDQEMNYIKGIHTQMCSRDSSFGPPWVPYNNEFFTGSDSAVKYHYSYEPFTPAYFNGFGVARMYFYPYKGAGKYTLKDIISHIETKYIRMPTNRTGLFGTYLVGSLLSWNTLTAIDRNYFIGLKDTGETGPYTSFHTVNYDRNLFPKFFSVSDSVYINELVNSVYYNADLHNRVFSNWMQLSSSFNFFNIIKNKSLKYTKGMTKDFEVSEAEEKSDNDDVWVIQPKWETPILNFYNKSADYNSNCPTGSITKGMWYQYGDDCVGKQGIWASVSDLPSGIIQKENNKGVVKNYYKKGYVLKNKQENYLIDKKKNAEVILFIKDYTNINGNTITLDKETYSFGAAAFSTNQGAAAGICSVINNMYFSSPGGFTKQYTNILTGMKFIADYYKTTEHPFKDDTTLNSAVFAVRIRPRDIDFCDTFRDPYKYNNSLISYEDCCFPDYYCYGERGNTMKISISSFDPLKAVFVGSRFSDRNVEKMGNDVYFRGGKDPIYKVESLADLLGFQKISKRMGEIADEKVIHEAVVAIPFIERNGRKYFFRIYRNQIDVALGKRQQDPKIAPPGDSIRKMVDSMQRYVFPPKFDFITNRNVKPFAMYIFEFETKLTRQDLKDIWQNLQPNIATKFETQTSTISHKLLENEFFRGKLESNIKWMVFKVKQKAEWNYFAKTADTSDDSRFKFSFEAGGKTAAKTSVPDYSYNWPYDFFSLVELIKIDAEIDMEKKEKVEQERKDLVESLKKKNTPTKKVSAQPNFTLPKRGGS